MADIPISLNLDKCLVPTYTNHPRIAEHAYFDTVLKAFVTPENLVSAEKAKKVLKKSTKPPPKKRSKKADAENVTTDVAAAGVAPEVVDDCEKRFLCEKAKSGISRCRKCGQTIDKGGLRFGYGSPDPRGEYGAIPIWFHIRCAPLEFIGFSAFDDTLASLCVNFAQLDTEAQSEVFETAGKGLNNIKTVLNTEDSEFADDFEDLSERLVHRRGVSVPLLPKPSEIIGANLLPFQIEGYSWMVAQEQNPSTRGGILADEMGMGKTLQTISLIVSRRDQVGPTLVVAPVAAVMQWYSEIEKFTGTGDNGCLSVHVYHGSQKIGPSELAKFDVVLTTYQTLENDYRKEANKAKVKCKYCKKMFLPGKLGFHLKYMCGPNAMRTMKQSLRQVKDRSATEKAKKTMGIVSDSATPSLPTITNVMKDIVKSSGLVDEDVVDSMNHYELINLYKQLGKTDEKGREVDEEEKVEEEEGVILSENELKKIAVADLKEELRKHQIDGWNRMKKGEIIGLILEKKLAMSVNLISGGNRQRSATKSAAKMTASKRKRSSKETSEDEDSSSDSSGSSSDDDVESSPVKKGGKKKPVSGGKPTIVVGRRSAAMKAMEGFKDDVGSEEEIVVRSKHVVKKRKKSVSETSESSEFSVSSDDSSSLSSDFTDSESSGSTISVDSEDSMDDSEIDSEESSPHRGKRRVKKSTRKSGSKKSPPAPRPLVSRKPKFDGEGYEGADDEEALEDVDLNNSPLHCVKWGRLVLDEAHRIKQRTNSTSLAAFAIAADFRWCLSGTPLQNRVGELYSLVRFLRFAPFAHYFCKGCDCKSLHFRFIDNRFCAKCGCARTKHYSYFKQVISGPIIKFGIGDGSALNVLKTQVLDTILLRRTKLERQADLNLPSMTIEIKKTKLTDEEIDFYESIYKQSMLKFDTFAAQGTLLHNYAHIFDLLTRLRQAVDHPYLIVYGTDYTVPVSETKEGRGICALCQDDIGRDEKRAIANCGHKFHSDCVREYVRESPELPTGGTGCPACFVPLTLLFEAEDDDEGNGDNVVSGQTNTPEEDNDELESGVKTSTVRLPKNSIVDRVGASTFKSSSKIEAVVAEILAMESDAKCLIFSQFTRMLDLVDFRLKQNGIGCAKLNGSQTLAQRSNIILSFNSDPSMKALLISLKAGGEGLNLQAANYVFLLDPWWNPASEMQAVQRAHRIGQTKPVKAIRFVTENTVEEKVIALQEMKQLVFEATIGQSQGAEKKLTESDLRFLFNH